MPLQPVRQSSSSTTLWIVIAVACLFFGAIVGYVIANRPTAADPGAVASAPTAASSPATAAPATGFVDENQVQALKALVAKDPTNVRALTNLGNMLYDAGRYSDAIPYYQQAFALDARNVNLSTDLGTALWYTGRADDALAQYDKSLQIDPNHPNTLMNVGIVRRQGKHDPAGAIAAWEKLLQTNPSFGDRAKVEKMIADARAEAGQPIQPVR